LSPASSWTLTVWRRTPAGSRQATADGELLVIVMVVARPARSGPAWVMSCD
jgi:hypothetical protein